MTAGGRGAGPLTGLVVHGHPLGERLGSGGFADVYRMDVPGSEPVAVKAVRRSSERPEGVDVEVSLLHVAEHPNVVRYLWHESGTGVMRDHVFIATELCDRSLEDEFAGLPPGPDRIAHAWKVVPRLANDALAGLAHLHGLEPKVIHRDIKPGNILVAPSGVWRVADFGIARLLGQGEEAASNPTLTFTPAFMPPDPLRDRSITPAADLFSLGATVQWAFTDALPWPSLPRHELLRFIGGTGRPVISPDLPAEWLPFVRAALDVRAGRRAGWDYAKLISWTPGNVRDAAAARANGPRRAPDPVTPTPGRGPTTTVLDPPVRPDRPDRRERATQPAVPPAAQLDTGLRQPVSGASPGASSATRAALTSAAVFVAVLTLLSLIILLT